VERLKAHLSLESAPIASVFLCKDVIDAGSFFIKDLLISLLRQLDRGAHPDADRTQSINSIRQALCGRLSKHSKAFLVFDGIDRCSLPVQRQVISELAILQRSKLVVMVTSRQPIDPTVNGKIQNKYCDAPGHDEKIDGTNFWTCQNCNGFDCCNRWKEEYSECNEW
jgi:hypothetical protein